MPTRRKKIASFSYHDMVLDYCREITLGVSVICCFICYLPFFLGYEVLSKTEVTYSTSLSSMIVQFVIVSMIAVICSKLFEIVALKGLEFLYQSEITRVSLSSCVLLAGYFLSNFFTALGMDETKLLSLYVCFFYSRMLFIVAPIISYTVDKNSNVALKKCSILYVLIGGLITTFLAWSSFVKIGVVGTIVIYLILSLFVVFAFIYSAFVVKVFLLNLGNPTCSGVERYSGLNVVIGWVYVVLMSIIPIAYGIQSWQDVSKSELCTYSVLDILVILIHFATVVQMSHHDKNVARMLLDSRRAFVRYVSHGKIYSYGLHIIYIFDGAV
jgi:hypothetical protein